jgi:large subunit ribosomal protein L16
LITFLARRVYLVLQPKKIKYKSIHKGRHSRANLARFTLSFGSAGILLTRPLQISSQRIFRLRLFIKRAARRTDYTLRKVWLNAFPHLPLTKKPIGSRMGKAKGKLSIWYAQLYPGTVLIEFKNLRFGRSFYYMTQLKSRIKGDVSIIYRDRVMVCLPLSKSKKMTIQSFW